MRTASSLRVQWTPVNPVTVGTVQFGGNSEVAVFQKVASNPNGYFSSFVCNESLLRSLSEALDKPHPKRHIRPYYAYKTTLKLWFGAVRTDQYTE